VGEDKGSFYYLPMLLTQKTQECYAAHSAHMISKRQKLMAQLHWQTYLYIN